MRVVLFFESAAGSELKHPNLSDSYDYTLGLLACQDGVFPYLKCYRSVNDHLKRLFSQLVPGLTLSRCCPYHKNDNRFVEQKNDALVRQYVGYARFDTPEQVAVLYADMSVYYNLFQSVLHLIEKTVVSDPTADESPGGAIPTLTPTHIRRRWDRDQTPCERLVATGTLLPTQQQRLQALYSQTNPLALRHRLPPTLRRLVNGKE